MKTNIHIEIIKEREAEYRRNYRHTPKGFTAVVYSRQTRNSILRGHNPPTYSLGEFRTWVFSQPNFETLFNAWIKSDYKMSLTPSVDRADDYVGYTIDNLLRICTFKENRERFSRDKRNGINNKDSKEVYQYKGDVLINKYYSFSEAGRKTGIGLTCISKCILGKRKTAGGYIWKDAPVLNRPLARSN